MNSGDQFHPPPPNDFEAFFEMYYAECRARIPGIQAIAAKWKFEDLLPGMSDFDTRFIMQDGMTVQDWCDMSTAVGDVHLDLCQRYPHWARNLEHLPGINLTWSEVTDALSYYPEYPQWTFYRTEQPDRLAALEQYLADRPWDEKDEYFHLSKFCLYYGRYDRKIDPPVNLGPYENKYPLHSRFMHYFCPPLQSALSILTKRPVRGKMEAVRLAREMFPDQNIFVEMLDVVERHYAVPELYKEPQLTDLEDRLEEAFLFLRDTLSQSITLIPGAHDKSMDEWKASLKDVMISPLMRAFGAARFSRLMKGRLRFYAAAPSHFDSTWPIRNELMRLKTNFFDTPARVYCEITTGTSPEDPTIILPWIYPGILDDEEFRCTEEFIRLLSDNYETGDQRHTASAIADVFDGFYSAQDKIIAAIREQSKKKAEPCT